MVKIAVCDDEENQVEALTNMIERNLRIKDIEYKIFKFISGEKMISSIWKFDICFLDIKMSKNNLTGIEIAKKIREVNERVIIIFITGYEEYVFDAFDVRAFHYILKPVEEEKLKKIMYSALLQLEKIDKFIVVKTMKNSTKILFKDIMYIESQQRKLKIHTTYSIFEYYHKLSDIEMELGKHNFFRCHRSYIVNFRYVNSFDSTFITLKNSEKVYISKYKINDFSKAFMYYLKNEEL